MITLYLCNAFSLSMLNREAQAGKDCLANVRTPRPISLDVVQQWLNLLSKILAYPVEKNRAFVKIRSNDDLIIVAQLADGVRLPEGCTELPEGASFEFWAI